MVNVIGNLNENILKMKANSVDNIATVCWSIDMNWHRTDYNYLIMDNKSVGLFRVTSRIHVFNIYTCFQI